MKFRPKKGFWPKHNQGDIAFSPGNSKLGNVSNVAFPPIISCSYNCKYCAKECYALKAYTQYPNVKALWDNNYRLYLENNVRFWECLDLYLDQYKPSFFRYFVSGDIQGSTFLDKMPIIAEKFHYIKFLTFTKYFDIFSSSWIKFTPDNLNFIFSMWFGMPEPDRIKGIPFAWVQDKANREKRIPKKAFHCPGYCEECNFCFNARKLYQDLYFDIH